MHIIEYVDNFERKIWVFFLKGSLESLPLELEPINA